MELGQVRMMGLEQQLEQVQLSKLGQEQGEGEQGQT